MIKVKGKGGIEAVVVADSVSSVDGQRITTFCLTYHRYIHSELMTHRMFSRNAMSSRAVPVQRMIDMVREAPAMPIHWGKNQAGMQAKEECFEPVAMDYDSYNDEYPYGTREEAWLEASRNACSVAESFAEAGYHKQIVNRLIEPYQMIRVLVTATSFDNFFHLRFHSDAQPEIFELARCMIVAMRRSTPEVLHPGEWHTPFVDHVREEDGLKYLTYQEDGYGFYMGVEDALKVSSSCAAQVSFRRNDTSLEKALAIYDKLVNSEPVHSSAFEHCATPMGRPDGYYTVEYEGGSYLDHEVGVTHRIICPVTNNITDAYSNNFKGWIQYRSLIKNNVCDKFDYSKEVDEDGLVITEETEI